MREVRGWAVVLAVCAGSILVISIISYSYVPEMKDNL